MTHSGPAPLDFAGLRAAARANLSCLALYALW